MSTYQCIKTSQMTTPLLSQVDSDHGGVSMVDMIIAPSIWAWHFFSCHTLRLFGPLIIALLIWACSFLSHHVLCLFCPPIIPLLQCRHITASPVALHACSVQSCTSLYCAGMGEELPITPLSCARSHSFTNHMKW